MVDRESHLTRHRIDAARLWLTAVVASMLLNLGLFGLMPDLVRQPVSGKDQMESFRTVRIVEFKPFKPEAPKQQRPTPPKQDKTVRRIDITRPVIKPQQVRPQPFRFDFKPQLPDIPTTLPVFPMETVAFESAPMPVMAPARPVPSRRFTAWVK